MDIIWVDIYVVLDRVGGLQLSLVVFQLLLDSSRHDYIFILAQTSQAMLSTESFTASFEEFGLVVTLQKDCIWPFCLSELVVNLTIMANFRISLLLVILRGLIFLLLVFFLFLELFEVWNLQLVLQRGIAFHNCMLPRCLRSCIFGAWFPGFVSGLYQIVKLFFLNFFFRI